MRAHAADKMAGFANHFVHGTGGGMLAVLAALFLLVIPRAADAEMYEAEYQTCAGGSTVAVVGCLADKTSAWDAKLNSRFKTAIQGAAGAQRVSLRQAQRLWIQYRDMNCRFYAEQEGSLREIAAAECLRSMTRDRAEELDQLQRN